MVVVQPRELRLFAAFLVECARDIRAAESACTDSFSQLKKEWRDDGVRAFEPKYNLAVAELDRFANVCARYAEYLEDKARRTDQYLGR